MKMRHLPLIGLTLCATAVWAADPAATKEPARQPATKPAATAPAAGPAAATTATTNTTANTATNTAANATAPAGAGRDWSRIDANKDNLVSPEEMEKYLADNPGPLKK